MENFFIRSTVTKLACYMILRNVIMFRKVNRDISTGKAVSKEEFGLAEVLKLHLVYAN